MWRAAPSFFYEAITLNNDKEGEDMTMTRRRFMLLAVALGTRLVPTLERDAAGLVESLRGRGVEVTGVRGRARLLSPLLAGSLERSLNLAEAMEARGYGRPGRTRVAQPAWTLDEKGALVLAAALVAIGAIWL